MSCVIIDYGSGNLHSALKSFERAAREAFLNQPITLTNKPEEVLKAERIVLPGVGAYADCLQGIEAIAGLRPALEEAVMAKGRPFFGICVGMQLLSTEGHEHGLTKGLGWIPGKVVPITPSDPGLKIPHMGWNTLYPCASDAHTASAPLLSASDAHTASAQLPSASKAEGVSVPTTTPAPHKVLEGIPLGPNGQHAYFVHSYHFEVANEADKLLTTDYGGPITAMVGRDNIIGTQFHPEKSQALGLKLITNFLNWRP